MKQYVVDAFTDRLFHGNQAAVCVLEKWLDDELMLNIAKENNFSETAFTVKEGEYWHVRWFTPGGEIDFCGHATLATSFVLFNFYCKDVKSIKFTAKIGKFSVDREGDMYIMDFPAYQYKPVEVTEDMEKAIGAKVLEAYMDRDLLLLLEDEDVVKNLKPDQELMGKLEGYLVAVTAEGREYDCVSRVFDSKVMLEEDPVTGSTHCMITPFWCNRLNKESLKCYQASERGGVLYTEVKGDRVKVSGNAVLYATGELNIG